MSKQVNNDEKVNKVLLMDLVNYYELTHPESGDSKRKQLLDRIAEKTVALGLLQGELRAPMK